MRIATGSREPRPARSGSPVAATPKSPTGRPDGRTSRSTDADAAAPRGGVARPRVLVAEDDVAFRTFVAGILESAGYEVVEAGDGGDLLECVADAAVRSGLEKRPFSVVVTDLRMPGLSGLDAVEFLRAGPWHRTPVIVMTAFGDAVTYDQARRLGAATVLDKPFDAEQLRRAVLEVAPIA